MIPSHRHVLAWLYPVLAQVHAYVAVPGGRTAYLAELGTGDQVLVADAAGNMRSAMVGRVKVEQRSLVCTIEAACYLWMLGIEGSDRPVHRMSICLLLWYMMPCKGGSAMQSCASKLPSCCPEKYMAQTFTHRHIKLSWQALGMSRQLHAVKARVLPLKCACLQVLVEAETADGSRHSTLLQNAETVRLIGPTTAAAPSSAAPTHLAAQPTSSQNTTAGAASVHSNGMAQPAELSSAHPGSSQQEADGHHASTPGSSGTAQAQAEEPSVESSIALQALSMAQADTPISTSLADLPVYQRRRKGKGKPAAEGVQAGGAQADSSWQQPQAAGDTFDVVLRECCYDFTWHVSSANLLNPAYHKRVPGMSYGAKCTSFSCLLHQYVYSFRGSSCNS